MRVHVFKRLYKNRYHYFDQRHHKGQTQAKFKTSSPIFFFKENLIFCVSTIFLEILRHTTRRITIYKLETRQAAFNTFICIYDVNVTPLRHI